jgi:prepilin-type N-terminal cleavage/methylation domain-containing protein
VSSDAARRPQGGFTIIEVLIALVILAVGLLALEAMGIGAARLVRRAELQSEFTTAATAQLEQTVGLIRADGNPAANQVTAIPGGSMRTQTAAAGVAPGQLWTVTVTVTPTASNVMAASDSIRLSTNVYQ